MSQWEKDFDDNECEEFDEYFKENDLSSFFDIPILQISDDLTSETEKTQEYIINSASKGPPDKCNPTSSLASSPLDLNLQPNNQNFKPGSNFHQKQPFRSHNPKLEAGFSLKESAFREEFYSIFLNNIKGKKIIPKEKVIDIHNAICAEAGVRKMNRDEYRSINTYFKHFAQYKDQIIGCIIKNKERLSAMIDLPSIIERANAIVQARRKLFNCSII